MTRGKIGARQIDMIAALFAPGNFGADKTSHSRTTYVQRGKR